MALPINIEDLLHRRKIESNRIEFKSGWNPDKIYHSICAFANDFENIGGGYILVGVEEENGIAKRPVKGIPTESIDKILKEMVGYDAKISPSYISKVSPEEIDGKYILVIWVPGGLNRPYSVAESVVTKKSVPKWYIRSKSSSIEAKGEILDELREMANRVPFDERGNEAISIDDISGLRVYEYLKTIKSKLYDEFPKKSLFEILDEMDLLTGPSENRTIKNVAAMMFCDNPDKFFPVTQVDIVIFPEGSIENPDIMIEVPKITGPVPQMIKETLSYLRTNVIKKKISKPSDDEKSDKIFNYPYQAFEEAVVNALYHRDYQEREPVEITVEPTHIDILSYAGPDRSISAEAIKAAQKLKARRYRNRRLGDFLKELDLTEGRATGVPTIQKALKINGSNPATIETDDNRSYFLMSIPCREDMVNLSSQNKDISIINTPLPYELEQQLKQVLVQVLMTDNEDIDTNITNGLIQVVVQVYQKRWSKYRKNTDFQTLFTALLQTIVALHKNRTLSATDILKGNIMDKIYELKRKIIEPLVFSKYIEMTSPDKPKSSKQSYCLTETGRKLFDL